MQKVKTSKYEAANNGKKYKDKILNACYKTFGAYTNILLDIIICCLILGAIFAY